VSGYCGAVIAYSQGRFPWIYEREPLVRIGERPHNGNVLFSSYFLIDPTEVLASK